MISEAPKITPVFRDLGVLAELCNILHGHFEKLVEAFTGEGLCLEFCNGERTVAGYFFYEGEPPGIGVDIGSLPSNVCDAAFYRFPESGEYHGIKCVDCVWPTLKEKQERKEEVANMLFRELGERCQINSAKHSN